MQNWKKSWDIWSNSVGIINMSTISLPEIADRISNGNENISSSNIQDRLTSIVYKQK